MKQTFSNLTTCNHILTLVVSYKYFEEGTNTCNAQICNALTLDSFKLHLKTYLFSLAFPDRMFSLGPKQDSCFGFFWLVVSVCLLYLLVSNLGFHERRYIHRRYNYYYPTRFMIQQKSEVKKSLFLFSSVEEASWFSFFFDDFLYWAYDTCWTEPKHGYFANTTTASVGIDFLSCLCLFLSLKCWIGCVPCTERWERGGRLEARHAKPRPVCELPILLSN